MSDDKLKEIFDSINSQMIVEQNVGYKNKYSPILTEEIDLYNAVIKYKEVIDKAINKLEKGISFCKHDSQGVYDKCNIAILREQEILDILKEVEYEKSND